MTAERRFVRRVLPVPDAALVVLLGLAVAILEGAGVFLLVPLLALVGIDTGTGATAAIAETAGRFLSAVRIPVTLGSVLIVYVALTAVQAGVARAEALTTVRVRESVAARTRRLLYRALTRMSWRAFIERHSSHYVHALTTQLERGQMALSQSLSFVTQSLIALVYVVIALRVAPLLSSMALGGGMVLLLLTRRHARALQTSGSELNAATQRLHTGVVEHLSNMKVARIFAAERQHLRHFEDSSLTVVSTWAAAGAAFAGSRWAFSVGAAVMLALVVYAGVTLFGLGAAAVLLLLYVFGRLVPRVGALQQLLHQILHSLPSLKATARELAHYEEHTEAEPDGISESRSLDVALRFEQVGFSYLKGQEILRDLSFEIPAGQVTVIVGPSGSGKTTIADLLLGLLEPEAGAILVDGQELTWRIAGAWRHHVAYVPQEAVLFNDTIRNNLSWAVPEAVEADMRQALTAAQADFVHVLPAGLDTVVGERGAWLSGGERQRLAIARALLRRPRLLVLDEPTSNLDAENERRILDVVRSLRGSATIVLISHREAALAIADRVVVIQAGRVVHQEFQTASVNLQSTPLA